MSTATCFQSREVTGSCDVCDAAADLKHLPMRPLGIYCEKHCPVCSTPSLAALAAARDRNPRIYKPGRQRVTAPFHYPKSPLRPPISLFGPSQTPALPTLSISP